MVDDCHCVTIILIHYFSIRRYFIEINFFTRRVCAYKKNRYERERERGREREREIERERERGSSGRVIMIDHHYYYYHFSS